MYCLGSTMVWPQSTPNESRFIFDGGGCLFKFPLPFFWLFGSWLVRFGSLVLPLVLPLVRGSWFVVRFVVRVGSAVGSVLFYSILFYSIRFLVGSWLVRFGSLCGSAWFLFYSVRFPLWFQCKKPL